MRTDDRNVKRSIMIDLAVIDHFYFFSFTWLGMFGRCVSVNTYLHIYVYFTVGYYIQSLYHTYRRRRSKTNHIIELHSAHPLLSIGVYITIISQSFLCAKFIQAIRSFLFRQSYVCYYVLIYVTNHPNINMFPPVFFENYKESSYNLKFWKLKLL